MPVASITLEEINKTILNNVYFKIIEDIVEAIKIPTGSTVILHNNLPIAKTDNSTNVSLEPNDNLPTTVSKRRLVINIDEEYNEDALTTTVTHQLSMYPIFIDEDIDVRIYPIYIKTDITISFTYITPSKSEAIRIRDDIRIRLSQARNINIHDVEYEILIPEVIEDFIIDIYELKKRFFPMALEEYVREHATRRLRVITDLANKENARLAVNERQIRIVGLFDFSPMPDKIEYDNENNNYKISFDYKLNLDVPRAMVVRYPVMVCNQVLPRKYIEHIENEKINSKEELNRELNYLGYDNYVLSIFESHRILENRFNIKLPLTIPLFDDFNKRVGHNGYGVLVSFLTEVDESDKKTLFNLKDLGDYYIHDKLLTFIRDGERNYCVFPFQSFIYFGLWQEGKYYDAPILEIDSDLNVKSKVELSLVRPTRVTISFILDITKLDRSVIDRLLNNIEVFFILLTEYMTVLRDFKHEVNWDEFSERGFLRLIMLILRQLVNKEDNDALAKLISILGLDKSLLDKLASYLYNNYPNLLSYLVKIGLIKYEDIRKGIYKGYILSENYGMRTVMSFYVVAKRKDGNEVEWIY